MFDSISFIRIFKTGFVNFFRNTWLSVAATMVMIITLIIFSFLYLMFSLTSQAVKNIKERVDVSIYTKKGLPEDKILKFKNEVEQIEFVKEVEYISDEVVFKQFKERNQNNPKVLAALNEVSENPFGATLRLKAQKLEDYPAIAQKLLEQKYKDIVKDVNYDDNRVVIARLGQILKITVSGGLGILFVFALIAILVIFNTITLTINNRKEEVEIMRLVGATNWYIRGPFLIESAFYAFFATLISAVLLLPVFTYVLPKVALFVNPQWSGFTERFLIYGFLLLGMATISFVLSFVSTFLAVRKYLRI